MCALSVRGLGKAFGARDLFCDVSFDVHAGDRLAVVGPNGCGKSTFLGVVEGRLDPDAGSVHRPRNAKLGVMAQDMGGADLSAPLLSWVMQVLPSWSDFWRRWEEAAAREDDSAMERLSAEQAALERDFGYNPEHRAQTVLHGLGFTDRDMDRPLGEFSGGWRERALLSRALVGGTDVLILDEPTNHLDLEAIRWLEDHLRSYKGILVFVVHDRIFLDALATHVLYLGATSPLFRPGNFSDYLQWAEENEKARQRQVAKLGQRIEQHREYIRRFRVKARTASQAQSKLKQVERLQEELESLSGDAGYRTLSFRLPEPARADKNVLAFSDVDFGFADQADIFRGLDLNVYRGQKIGVVGPNGAGKSTLLKLAVGELTPDSGRVKLGGLVQVGYYAQHVTEILRPQKPVLDEFRRLCDPRLTEQELKDVLGLFMLGGEYWDRKVERLSGGEKARLVLASLFLARANFLVLDEPTNHLDLESREALVAALQDYQGTVFMVAHDRWVLSQAASEVWELSPGGDFDRYMGGWRQYEAARLSGGADANDGAAGPRGEGGSRTPARRKGKGRDTRRQAADIRNKASRDLAPLRKEYERLESDLATVIERIGELEAALADPSLYEAPNDMARVNAEYKQARENEERLFAALSDLEERIKALEAERDRKLAGAEA